MKGDVSATHKTNSTRRIAGVDLQTFCTEGRSRTRSALSSKRHGSGYLTPAEGGRVISLQKKVRHFEDETTNKFSGSGQQLLLDTLTTSFTALVTRTCLGESNMHWTSVNETTNYRCTDVTGYHLTL